MDPARIFTESLTPRPELENSLGPERRFAATQRYFRCWVWTGSDWRAPEMSRMTRSNSSYRAAALSAFLTTRGTEMAELSLRVEHLDFATV